MSYEHSNPQIGLDLSAERLTSTQYHMDMHYMQQRLPFLQRLDDVSIRVGEEVIGPHKEQPAVAFVPKGYIPDHMLEWIVSDDPDFMRLFAPDGDPEKVKAAYLKYLFFFKHFSIKSKLAQSGWKIIPNFGVDPYLTFPMEINDRGFYFWVLICNLNPQVSFLTPKQPFPAFRFYIPSQRLEGMDLVEQVRLMQNPNLPVENSHIRYQLDQLAGLPPTDPLFFGKDRLISVILQIEREAEFAKQKTVAVQDLLDCPSTDRDALDKLWGLNWSASATGSERFRHNEIIISESTPLVIPEGIAGLIDHNENQLDTTFVPRDPNHGIFQHIESPLIDPKYGFPSGKPIRLENYALSVAQTPKSVRMFLHRSD